MPPIAVFVLIRVVSVIVVGTSLGAALIRLGRKGDEMSPPAGSAERVTQAPKHSPRNVRSKSGKSKKKKVAGT